MLAVFNTPCQFCGSTAKNTKQHVDKCSAFFQVAAIRHLLHQGHLVATLTAQKAPALKPHETQPAYKSFALRNTPLGKAFHGKLVVGSGVQTPGDGKEMNPVSTLTTAHGHVGGQVPNMFRRFSSSMPIPPALPEDAAWTCRLKLRNPHKLCYMNATLIALMHGLSCHDHPWRSLQFLRRVGQQAADQSQPLLLRDIPRFAQLCRQWGFEDRQEDAAEFLLKVLLPASQFNTVWEQRSLTPEGPRLLDQGELPITLLIPEEATDLQQVVNEWYKAGDCNAIAYTDGLVILQLLRFRREQKLQNRFRVSSSVQRPIFIDGISTVWQTFRVISFVVHEGPSIHRGHYRAMLRVGGSWAYQDDGVVARPSALADVHFRNVYLLWVARAQE